VVPGGANLINKPNGSPRGPLAFTETVEQLNYCGQCAGGSQQDPVIVVKETSLTASQMRYEQAAFNGRRGYGVRVVDNQK
jgi:hypothetical protein